MSTGPPPYSSSAMDIGAGGLHTLNADNTRSNVAITRDATPLLGPPGALRSSHPLVNPFSTNFSGSPSPLLVPLPISISNSNFHRPTTVNSDRLTRPIFSRTRQLPLSLPGNATLDDMPTPRFDDSSQHHISYASTSTPRMDIEGVRTFLTPGSRPFTAQPSLAAVPSPFNQLLGPERSATAFDNLPPAIASSRVLPYPLYRPSINDLNYPTNTREFLIPHSATPAPFTLAPVIPPTLRDVRSTPIIHHPQPQLTTPLILRNDSHPLIDFNNPHPHFSPPATATYVHSNASPVHSHQSWQSHLGPDQPLSPLRSHVSDREQVYYNSPSSVPQFLAQPLAPQIIHAPSPYVQPYELSHSQPSPYMRAPSHTENSPYFSQAYIPHFQQPTVNPPPSILVPRPNVIQSTNSSSKPSLPSTKDIPLLSGASTWTPWNTQVRALIMHSGAFSHIADTPTIAQVFDPDLIPSYPPDSLTITSTTADYETFSNWWTTDGIASHILTTRLSADVNSSVPLPNERAGERRSARFIYETLRRLYGCGDFASAAVVEEKLRGLRCASMSGISQFMITWRAGINLMQSAGHLPSNRNLLLQFVDGLPVRHNGSLTMLRDSVVQSLNGPDATLPPLWDVFQRVETIGSDYDCTRLRTSTANTPSSNNRTTNSSTSNQATANPATSAGAASTSTCDNCGGLHPTSDCFQKGGAMEGRRDEVLAARRSARRSAHANLALSKPTTASKKKDSVSTSATTSNLVPPDKPSPTPKVDAPSLSLVAMSVAPVNEITFDSYAMPVHEFFDELTNAYMAFPPQLDTILDSGCTSHIFRDRSLFWNYREDTSTSIRTANCGILSTLGRGDVKVRLSIGGQTITWTLQNCLHAPDVPVNLISVGLLQNSGMTIAFGKGSTILSFPPSHGSLSFEAVIYNRLSFVRCDFIRPPPRPATALISMDQALPVFAEAPLTPELWHRRLGHPGAESTKAMLTKPYADGITWTGTMSNMHCIPCLVGKGPQTPYTHNAHRVENICELIHIDTCGPYPVQTPRKELYFFIMLDDASNYGCTSLLVKKSDAFLAWKRVTASWELVSGNKVRMVRMDGAKEFVEGNMGNYLRDAGIAIQITAPYAHSQNGKAEHYIRTIADTAQTLLADAKLPMSFWGDAVRTAQFLRNRTPTKTLTGFQTPYEAMHGTKPDLSDLRVWGCECWFSIPPETRDKGGPRREQGIFVGYDENRKGWSIRNINGKYHFSRSVVFNELVPGHLSPHRFISQDTKNSTPTTPFVPTTRTLRSQTSSKHPLLDMVIRERNERLAGLALHLPVHQSAPNVEIFIAYNTTLSFFGSGDFSSTNSSDDWLVFEHTLSGSNRPLKSFRQQEYDLTRPPEDFDEAMARPDQQIWIAAMNRETASLTDRKAYSVSDLPPGRKAIGVRWVYDYKRDETGIPISGKEKARLVAQGFSQRPEDFNHTYAPVPKLTSDRILLAYANHHDLEILFFDVKTAFLHAKLENTIFIKQIPGFKLNDPSLVLRLHVALYGLRQSAYEFYQLLRKLLLDIGLIRCEVDHAVFIGRWSIPPLSSISMPSDGSSLLLIVPVHVDDGLVITNSVPLYKWFIGELSKSLEIVDLGTGSMYLGMRITRDRPRRKLWISQKAATIDLLKNWDMLDVTPNQIPLASLPDKFPPAGPNSLPGITDADVKITFQRLVGSLLYLSICSRPDISYAALALSQFNSSPTRSHLLAAKGVLRYLSGTLDYALEYPTPSDALPPSVTPHIHACALSDADWASDSSDRRSISGYAFYFFRSLVSWSSTKQKSIAASSTESEYYALSHATREALWIRLFMTINGFPIPRPFPFLGDNQSTLTIANDPSHVNSKRTKHIDVRYHFFREHISDGTFITIWVPTGDMIADIFTKPLGFASFSKHRSALGLISK